ncbi:tRNA endonuclease-like protein [Serratia phage vB_SmaM-Susuwatari]|nr:tRNA endonuclease-like protein [Serratia phage vB_SmaM-Susuwatari]
MMTSKPHYVEYYYPDREDKRKELSHMISSANWMKYHHPALPFCHVPNEGMIPVQYREQLLSSGMKPGCSDFLLLAPRQGFTYAAIELKRATKELSTPVSDKQIEWLKACRAEGACSVVCYGFKSFKLFVEWYLN